jgi:hypothetical protein
VIVCQLTRMTFNGLGELDGTRRRPVLVLCLLGRHEVAFVEAV